MLRLPSASLLLVASVTSLLGACVIEAGTDDASSTLTVTNESSFDLRELYITDSLSAGWGPNELAGTRLFPGEQVTLVGISCSTYDVLMVDETGAECEVDGMSLCFQDADWVITNGTCSVFKRVDNQPKPSDRVRDLPAKQ